MNAVGLAAGRRLLREMVHDARTMVALRLPFVLCAVGGLMVLWWMLARLVSRRVAWLALLVVGHPRCSASWLARRCPTCRSPPA